MIPLWANSLGLNAGLSFWLPLDDLGAGAVNTTPSVASGSPTPTFARATTATTILPNGLIGSVGVGVARSCYSPAGVYLGYLAEEARTNYITFSNDLSNASWAKRNGHVVTSTNNPAPDGTSTASLITVTTASPGTSQGLFFESAANGNVAHDCSFYVKNNSAITSATLVIKDRGTDTIRATKLIGVTAAWTRVDVSGTPAGGSAGFRFEFQAEQANGSFFVWGAQGEAGAFATSVMPTSGATFTRNADVLTYAASGNADPASGTFYGEHTPIGSITSVEGVWALNDGTSNNRIDLRDSNGTLNGIETSGGVGQANINLAAVFSLNVTAKVAQVWSAARANVYGNGVAGTATTIATPPASPTLIKLGCLDASANQPNAAIKNVRIWTRALADSQLVSLTS